MANNIERIVKAAIQIDDKIYTGFHHGECFEKVLAEKEQYIRQEQQGFITNKGRFVDRKTAMKIAKEAGQVAQTLNKETLISEDLHLQWLHEQEQQILELNQVISDVKEYCKKQFNWFENTEFKTGYDNQDISNAYFDVEGYLDMIKENLWN